MDRLFTIAGPCSAESESQLLRTAGALKDSSPDYFRAGLWKPRTKPGCFEGMGEKAIPWMQRVREVTGLRICTEVACREHVEACLNAGFDLLWIGARTTTNPFLVEEIATALEGSSIPVFVKNPASRDIVLWEGAVERLMAHGIKDIGLVHRGFPSFGETLYRNAPEWQAAARMRSAFPGLRMICDPSHIAGDSRIVPEIAQQSLDLGLDGLMVECHVNPGEALSDTAQQLTPEAYKAMLAGLNVRRSDADEDDYRNRLSELRSRIDLYDDAILDALARRIEISREIGRIKKEHNVSILQLSRWDEIMERALSAGRAKGLSGEFVRSLFEEIHKASAASQK